MSPTPGDPGSGPGLAAALAGLRDIHPPAISAWSVAEQAVVALALAAAALASGLWLARSRSLRRRAMRELARIRRESARGPPGSALAEVAVLLRRYVLACRPAAECAGLTGERWLRYLVNLAELPQASDERFERTLREALLSGAYRPPEQPAALDAVFNEVARWLAAAPEPPWWRPRRGRSGPVLPELYRPERYTPADEAGVRLQ